MAKYRKLGRTASQRKALIRAEVTNLLHHGKIVTTEAKAKEIRKVAEKLIALAVKEKDNFETVTVDAKVAKKDENGKRVKEVVDGKKVTVYETVQKEIKKRSEAHGRDARIQVRHAAAHRRARPRRGRNQRLHHGAFQGRLSAGSGGR